MGLERSRRWQVGFWIRVSETRQAVKLLGTIRDHGGSARRHRNSFFMALRKSETSSRGPDQPPRAIPRMRLKQGLPIWNQQSPPGNDPPPPHHPRVTLQENLPQPLIATQNKNRSLHFPTASDKARHGQAASLWIVFPYLSTIG